MSYVALNGRAVARQVLRRVRRDGAYANIALTAALERSNRLSDVERSFATELVYGVLRQRRLIDHVLGLHTRRPLARVDADVLDALRVAAYQIVWLDRVPAHAAVNEAVQAVARLRGRDVAGFANAVLRRVSPADLDSELPTDECARLAVQLSLPDDLWHLLREERGIEEASALAKYWIDRASLIGRVNRSKASRDQVIVELEREGASVERGQWAECAMRIAGLARPFHAQSYVNGLWSAQDEAAQLVVLLLDPQQGERVLDACAGLGGKTMHIAEILARVSADGADRLWAIDKSAQKLALLGEHALRLGLPVKVMCAELQTATLESNTFDRVLLDAPCSGLGVIHRHPELKWRWRRELIDELVALQRVLLRTAVRMLRPGGVLVYSVCTVTEAEGPGQLRWLLSEYDDLTLDSLPMAIAPELRENGAMRTWPHRHRLDGFFAARVRRKR